MKPDLITKIDKIITKFYIDEAMKCTMDPGYVFDACKHKNGKPIYGNLLELYPDIINVLRKKLTIEERVQFANYLQYELGLNLREYLEMILKYNTSDEILEVMCGHVDFTIKAYTQLFDKCEYIDQYDMEEMLPSLMNDYLNYYPRKSIQKKLNIYFLKQVREKFGQAYVNFVEDIIDSKK